MKQSYTITAVAFLLAITVTNAQVVITSQNVPDPGTNFIRGTDEAPVGIDPGSAGPGQTWDFSSLEPDEVLGYSYLNPASTPFPEYFPEANLAVHSVDTAYSYLHYDADSYEMLGFMAEVEGEEYLFDYIPDMLIMEFPFEYGDGFIQDYAFEWIYNMNDDSIRIKNSVNRTLEADAYGTVILPAGNFEALRVSVTQVSKDSTWANILGNWMLVSATISTTNYYEWYTDDADVDMLLVSLAYDESWSTLESADFFRESFVGVGSSPGTANARIYPNPSSGRLFLDAGDTDIARVQVTNLAGQMVLDQEITSGKEKIDLGEWPDGLYFIQGMDGNSSVVFQEKFMLAR